MPNGVAPYKRTPTFSFETVPAGLTRDHATKEGVWGKIHVVAGRLEYNVPSQSVLLALSAGETAIVEPTILHKVTLSPEAEFFVEFWR
jgi:tellurite methyltransferase